MATIPPKPTRTFTMNPCGPHMQDNLGSFLYFFYFALAHSAHCKGVLRGSYFTCDFHIKSHVTFTEKGHVTHWLSVWPMRVSTCWFDARLLSHHAPLKTSAHKLSTWFLPSPWCSFTDMSASIYTKAGKSSMLSYGIFLNHYLLRKAHPAAYLTELELLSWSISDFGIYR